MTTLTTERLVIRNFTIDDASALREIILQYQASEYAVYDLAWPTSVDEIRGVAEWFASGDTFLAVGLRESGGLNGYVALNPVEEASVQDHGPNHVYGLGYCFNFDYHGRGYATEACRAALGRFRRIGCRQGDCRYCCRKRAILQAIGWTWLQAHWGRFNILPDKSRWNTD